MATGTKHLVVSELIYLATACREAEQALDTCANMAATLEAKEMMLTLKGLHHQAERELQHKAYDLDIASADTNIEALQYAQPTTWQQCLACDEQLLRHFRQALEQDYVRGDVRLLLQAKLAELQEAYRQIHSLHPDQDLLMPAA